MADPRYRMIHPAVRTLEEDLSQIKTLGSGRFARACIAPRVWCMFASVSEL